MQERTSTVVWHFCILLGCDIKYFETIIYEGTNKIHKFYAWDDGKGKIYQVDIYGDLAKKDAIKNVIDIFEKSIKFKQ